MRIGVTSQNFRTITGHAGKARRFLIYDAQPGEPITEVGRLDLPKEMSLHEYRGDDHPIFALDAVVTAGCGEGFARRLQQHGVRLVTTAESSPVNAVNAIVRGEALPPAEPHAH